jgi:NAD(P)-dependent dehydrogenase (short-subunit alcohol dehydrogenase family)
MIGVERTSYQPEARPCCAASRKFDGQMAVVTGASSGIGRAIAEELAAQGASLCLLGRRPPALHDVAPDVREGARRMIYQLDLASGEQIENFAARFMRDGGRADILVHSAGVIAIGAL